MSSTNIRSGQTIQGLRTQRRQVLALALGALVLPPLAAWPRTAFAQKPGRSYRIGWLTTS